MYDIILSMDLSQCLAFFLRFTLNEIFYSLEREIRTEVLKQTKVLRAPSHWAKCKMEA